MYLSSAAEWPLKSSKRRWGVLSVLTTLALLLGTVAGATNAQAAENSAGSTVRMTQTFYTWVSAGEAISVDFAKIASENRGATSFDPVIEVRDPSGSLVYTCNSITHVSPVGTNCAFSTTAPTDGVWSATLAKSNPSATSPIGQVQMSWAIKVSDEGTEIPGRTWSERFAMSDSLYSVMPTGVDLSLWYQTENGYTYRADRLNMQGIDSVFESNAFGNMNTDTCTPAYRSLFSDPSLVADPGPYRSSGTAAADFGCDFTPYKIFFEVPNSDLPEEVTLPDGTETWLLKDVSEPLIEGLSFESDQPGSRSGTVKATISNFEGTLEVQVDVDNDGVFNGPLDRSFPARVLNGQLSATFDGLDAASDPIALDTPMAFRLSIDRTAEIHFTDGDLELLREGIRVELLNGSNPGYVGLSWDDTWVTDPNHDPQANTKCSTTSPLTGENVSSAGAAVHGWGMGTCTGISAGAAPVNTPPAASTGGSWGNNRSIDIWTFADSNAEAVADVPGFRLIKSADPVSGTQLEEGDTVTYSVTTSPVTYAHPEVVTPTYAAQTWSGRYTDDVSDVRDNATVPLTDLASSPSAGSSYVVGANSYTWTGVGIPLASSVVTTYQATVNAVDRSGDLTLHNIAYAHSSETPPLAPEDCTPGLCGETTHPLQPAPLEPGFTLTKSADPASGTQVSAGQTITYTVTGTNTGQTALNPVEITDDMSRVLNEADLVADSVTSSRGDAPIVNGTSLSWSGSLPVGADVVITYQVRVHEDVANSVLLQNVVSGSAVPTDPETPDVPGTDEPIVPPEQGTEHPTPPAPGTPVTPESPATPAGPSSPGTPTMESLQKTGGEGTGVILLVGLALIAGSGILLALRRRSRVTNH